VAAPLVLTCSTTLGPVITGIPYSVTCTASGGTALYTFSLGGTLPTGLAASPAAATYIISGTPTAAGGYNFTAQVRDNAGQTAAQAFGGTLSAPPTIGTFNLSAVPGVSQFTATLTLSNPAPTALSGTLCLSFAADPSVGNAANYQSQEVVFATGTTSTACGSTLNNTLAFTVPSGSTTALWSGNSSQFGQGTVAGTITVTLRSLTDSSGNSLLPATAPSQRTTVPVVAPTLMGTPTMTLSANRVTVAFNAVTPKRSLTGVTCTFASNAGQPITTSVSFLSGSFAGMDQTQWFATPASVATGGSFSLSVTFPCTNCSALTGVQVALSN